MNGPYVEETMIHHFYNHRLTPSAILSKNSLNVHFGNKSVESPKRKLLAANEFSAGSFRWSARRDTHISTCFFKPPNTMPQLLSQCAFLSSAQF